MKKKIITFCGRMSLYEDMKYISSKLQVEEKIPCILPTPIVPLYTSKHTVKEYGDIYSCELLHCHFRKIELSNAIIVFLDRETSVNRLGVGESTYNEILYARNLEKDIYYTKRPINDEGIKYIPVKIGDIEFYKETYC